MSGCDRFEQLVRIMGTRLLEEAEFEEYVRHLDDCESGLHSLPSGDDAFDETVGVPRRSPAEIVDQVIAILRALPLVPDVVRIADGFAAKDGLDDAAGFAADRASFRRGVRGTIRPARAHRAGGAGRPIHAQRLSFSLGSLKFRPSAPSGTLGGGRPTSSEREAEVVRAMFGPGDVPGLSGAVRIRIARSDQLTTLVAELVRSASDAPPEDLCVEAVLTRADTAEGTVPTPLTFRGALLVNRLRLKSVRSKERWTFQVLRLTCGGSEIEVTTDDEPV